jgi:ATP-dependent DNA helicase RecG
VTFPSISHNRKNEGVNEGVRLEIEGVNEGVEKELTEILNYLRNNPGRRVPEIAEHINKSISTVERYLKILRDNDLIGFNGAPKTGGYIIIK